MLRADYTGITYLFKIATYQDVVARDNSVLGATVQCSFHWLPVEINAGVNLYLKLSMDGAVGHKLSKALWSVYIINANNELGKNASSIPDNVVFMG